MENAHIALVKALLLKHFTTCNGVCHGTTIRWLEACLLQQEDRFHSRIEKILKLDERFFEQFEKAQEKIKRREELTEDELALYDIHAFLDSIALYQLPFNYRELFNANLNQLDIQAVAQLACSDAIQAQGGLASMSMHPQICTEQEIEILLKQIAAFVDASATKEEELPVITFLLSCTNHTLGLTYQPKQESWSVMDINQWPPVKTKDIQSASQTVYSGLLSACSDDTPYVAFNITLITNTIKQLPEFALNLKTISPEINSEFIKQRTLKGTFAYVAAQNGHANVIAALAKAGANLNAANKDGITPAYIAAQNGHANVIAALAEAKANLDAPGTDGTTPAQRAAFFGHANVIAALAEAKANLDAPDHDGKTPAYKAASIGHAYVIAALAEAGANLDAPNNDGETPAHKAVWGGHADVIAALAEAKANLDTPNNYGMTLAYIAAWEGHADVIAALAKAGAKLNVPDKDGRTPAFIAAKKGHSDVIAALAEAGANLDAPDNDGKTPAFIAAQFGHPDVIKLLPFNNNAYRTSAKSLRDFSKSHPIAVQKRMEELISDSDVLSISISPEQIAYVMGHDEIVHLLKEKKQNAEKEITAISKYNVSRYQLTDSGMFADKRSRPIDEAPSTLPTLRTPS